MTRRLIVLLVVAALGFSLTACGKKGAPESPSEDQAAEQGAA